MTPALPVVTPENSEKLIRRYLKSVLRLTTKAARIEGQLEQIYKDRPDLDKRKVGEK